MDLLGDSCPLYLFIFLNEHFFAMPNQFFISTIQTWVKFIIVLDSNFLRFTELLWYSRLAQEESSKALTWI